jgi:hypothetical protein
MHPVPAEEAHGSHQTATACHTLDWLTLLALYQLTLVGPSSAPFTQRRLACKHGIAYTSQIVAMAKVLRAVLQFPAFIFGVWVMFWSLPLGSLFGYLKVFKIFGTRNDVYQWQVAVGSRSSAVGASSDLLRHLLRVLQV